MVGKSPLSNGSNGILLATVVHFLGYKDNIFVELALNCILFILVACNLNGSLFLGCYVVADSVYNKIMRRYTARQQHRQQAENKIPFHIILFICFYLYDVQKKETLQNYKIFFEN